MQEKDTLKGQPMLNSLELKGFQSHLHTKLEFADGVTVVVGPSRNGKTSALRALRWIVENRPIGIDHFITHGQKEISATLKLNGHSITRRKNSKENIYILNGEIFAGIGSDVPAPISKLLNFSDINTAGQFDVPFLLFDSPGAVARYLNQIVHLEKIDTALANVASLKRQNDQEIRTQETRIGELEQLELSFPDLVAAEEFIVELETSKQEWESRQRKIDGLSFLQGNLIRLRIQLEQTLLPDWMEPKVAHLHTMNGHKEALEYTKEALTKLQNSLIDFRIQINELKPIVKQESVVDSLSDKNHWASIKRKHLGRLRTYAATLETKRTELSAKLAIIKAEDARFTELMPEICPLCGK